MTSTLRVLPALFALSAWLLTALPAHADVIGVQLFVNGKLVGAQSAEPDPNGAVPIAFDAANAGFQIDGSALLDVDPFISFAVAVANFTPDPLTFAFLFSFPYTGGPYNLLESEFSSEVTDFTGGGVTMAPSDASGFISIPQIDGVNNAATSLGTGCNLVLAPLASSPCDALSSASAAVVTLADGNFGVVLAFSLTGDLDSATASGRIELTKVAVPEPMSALLVGLGLSVVAVRRRRR